MSEPSTEAQLRTIAAQLAHPDGEAGVEMGHTMNRSNTAMVLRTIEALHPQDGDRFLELGHGRCVHLGNLLAPLHDTIYHGLEVSRTMHEASIALNQVLVGDGRAGFSLYDGRDLPFADNSFTKVFTVNTLYFWQDPVALLNELHRVLVPGGSLCVTYAHKGFMEKLPFVRYGFALYDDAAFAQLAASTAFRGPAFIHHHERVISKDGQEMERTYSVVTLVK